MNIPKTRNALFAAAALVACAPATSSFAQEFSSSAVPKTSATAEITIDVEANTNSNYPNATNGWIVTMTSVVNGNKQITTGACALTTGSPNIYTTDTVPTVFNCSGLTPITVQQLQSATYETGPACSSVINAYSVWISGNAITKSSGTTKTTCVGVYQGKPYTKVNKDVLTGTSSLFLYTMFPYQYVPGQSLASYVSYGQGSGFVPMPGQMDLIKNIPAANTSPDYHPAIDRMNEMAAAGYGRAAFTPFVN